MNSALYFAVRYLRYYKWQTLILFFCLSVTVCLPMALRILSLHYQEDLSRRAGDTPLILGVQGHRFDLTMNALYFRTDLENYCTMADAEAITDSELAQAYPVFVRYTASKIPIAGITIDYFNFRKLTPVSGSLPLMLGDVVLGAGAAKQLNKTTGDSLVSDQINLYSLAAQYPLKMRIVGVLAPTGTADDDVVFADLKTVWIIQGLVHGHDDLAKASQQKNVAIKDENNLVANANVTTYVEITGDNIDGFHLHGQPEDLPLTSIICVPHDDKSSTILKARYKMKEHLQLLAPVLVIDDMMKVVFKIEFFFHTSLFIVAVATTLLLALIVLLSLRLRKGEFDTLHAIGCSRNTIVAMVLVEWLIIIAASLLFSVVTITLIISQLPNISHLV